MEISTLFSRGIKEGRENLKRIKGSRQSKLQAKKDGGYVTTARQ